MAMFGRGRNVFADGSNALRPSAQTQPTNPFSQYRSSPGRGVNALTGLVQPGNIDLDRRPQVPVGDGSYATVRSLNFSPDGKHEFLIPTVSDDGRIMGDEEAIQHFYRTGKHLGIFASPESAVDYAKRLSDRQGDHYGRR